MSSLNTTYYGPFFWLATISFLVPLVVAVQAFREVPLTTKPVPQPDASGVDHRLWDYLLKAYVSEGLVDYDGIARDYLFRTYLRQLSDANPQRLNEKQQLALYCNAYNAFVINGVIIHKIRDSVMNFQAKEQGFFDREEVHNLVRRGRLRIFCLLVLRKPRR